MITRTPVQSTAVKSAGHDGSTCEIEMNGNRVYRLTGIVKSEFDAFMASESKGRALPKLLEQALDVTRVEHDAEDVEPEDGDNGIETRHEPYEDELL